MNRGERFRIRADSVSNGRGSAAFGPPECVSTYYIDRICQ